MCSSKLLIGAAVDPQHEQFALHAAQGGFTMLGSLANCVTDRRMSLTLAVVTGDYQLRGKPYVTARLLALAVSGTRACAAMLARCRLRG
jgi:hypothetical protein